MCDWSEVADVVIKGAALFGAAAFFGYKTLSGFNNQNLSLTLACDRSHPPTNFEDFDSVIARISVEKGTTAALALEGLEVRFRWGAEEGAECIVRVEINRLTIRPCDTPPRFRVSWREPDLERPYLYISPGEKTNFSCVASVPVDRVCTVEVVAFGRRRRSTFQAQWRASSLAVPIRQPIPTNRASSLGLRR